MLVILAMTDHAPMKLEKHYTLAGLKGDSIYTTIFFASLATGLLRPVHTRHNLNAYLIRNWTMRIKYALVPSTLLKSKSICQTYEECP